MNFDKMFLGMAAVGDCNITPDYPSDVAEPAKKPRLGTGTSSSNYIPKTNEVDLCI